MERCGKINASNSGSDSWTGIGVVAGFYPVVLIMQWPHRRNGEVTWRSELLQKLQEVRGNCKTRNRLNLSASELPNLRCGKVTLASEFGRDALPATYVIALAQVGTIATPSGQSATSQ